MASLIIEDCGQTRAATPAEIIRTAESMCDLTDLYSFPAETPDDVAAFARWCVAPIKHWCFLIVVADQCGDVFRYWVLKTYNIATVVRVAVHAAASTSGWIVAAHPAAMPVKDVFAKQIEAELAEHNCENVHYLRVQADEVPAVTSRLSLDQPIPFLISRSGGQKYAASAETVYLMARILAARSYERGQVLRNSRDAEITIQLCAGALRGPSVDLVVLDDQFRFLKYLQAYRGNLEFILQHVDSIATQINLYEAHTTILVSCQTSRMMPFTAVDRFLIATWMTLLASKAKPPEAYVVVGTDRAWSYRPARRMDQQQLLNFPS